MFDLRTIAEVEGAGVKAGKHAEWREQIIVPPLPQSALTGCSLIDIDYFIQVRVCVCASLSFQLVESECLLFCSCCGPHILSSSSDLRAFCWCEQHKCYLAVRYTASTFQLIMVCFLTDQLLTRWWIISLFTVFSASRLKPVNHWWHPLTVNSL